MKETNTFGLYEISTDSARLDRARIHRWLSTDTYWALGRSREEQDAAIDGSLNFGAYEREGGAMAAYARVVTDLATFAWLCDVYVAPGARGTGLGTALAAAVRDHLAPHGVGRVLLATRDAHGVYGKVGFTPLEDPGLWMSLDPRQPPGPAGPRGRGTPAPGTAG
ncbi:MULTISPECIES: GNAT family N-acetyltransferase [Streptomyces]|uniref:GNAT family N-acetyltransferase n=1 Tax=Streptomyces sudanensis TaxID=436397 RepID=A0ABY4TGR3_9ACTN|nr:MULTISPECIES: GNAT family N-acetyltransferase [Streptomyces]URN17962.1 GNAT family N-acetyltransferase [Streptomyces sudanensis]